MSLTTRAKVLQTLGLTDDADSFPALSFGMNTSTKTSVTIAVNSSSTTLTVTPDPGTVASFNLTSAGYDTLAELAGAIEALGYIGCEVAAPDGGTYSTLLNPSQTLTLNSGNLSGQLVYSNAAAGNISAFIDQLILDVDAAVERQTGRNYTSAARTEKYDGDGTPFLQLRSFPVSSVSSVALVDASGSTSALAATDYRTDLNNGRLVLNDPVQAFGGGASGYGGWFDAYPTPIYTRGWVNGWPVGFQNIIVTYTAGYTTVPDDLARMATEWVVELYLNRRKNPRNASTGAAGVSESFLSADDLAKKHAARLSPFVRMTA